MCWDSSCYMVQSFYLMAAHYQWLFDWLCSVSIINDQLTVRNATPSQAQVALSSSPLTLLLIWLCEFTVLSKLVVFIVFVWHHKWCVCVCGHSIGVLFQMVREALASQLQTTGPLATNAASVTLPATATSPQGPSSLATVLSSSMIQQQQQQQPPLLSGLPSLSPQLPVQPSLEVTVV